MKLGRQKSLEAFSEQYDKIDYPVYVPAKKRVRFLVHIMYPYAQKEKPNANLEERTKYEEDLEKYVANELGKCQACFD